MDVLTFCNGTYRRDEAGWHYSWGEPVPGARDLTLYDIMVITNEAECVEIVQEFRPLTTAERRWLEGDAQAMRQVLLHRRSGLRPNAADLIVGLTAPELHPLTLLTVGDIARRARVSKATIDSYRYRGYLPVPQVTRGRTPLWARPVVRKWLQGRPGSGWRSDLYEPSDRPATPPMADLGEDRSLTRGDQGRRVRTAAG
jgi:hypothetical protein